jgi:hypothetical protein
MVQFNASTAFVPKGSDVTGKSLLSRIAVATIGLGLLVLPATAQAATASPPACPSSSCRVLASGLQDAFSVTLDGHGSAFLSYSHGQLERVDLATGQLTTIATGLGNLRGVATDGAGSVYVADYAGNVVQVDAATGAHRTFATGLGEGLMAVAYGHGHLYAGNTLGPVWDITGGVARQLTAKAGMVADLAVGPDGSVYAADIAGTVTRVDPTGAVHVLTSNQYEPQSVQVAANGLVYFAAAGFLHSINPTTGAVSPDLRLGGSDNLWDFGFGADNTSVALNAGQLWEVTGFTG